MNSKSDNLERIIPEQVGTNDVLAQASLALHYERYRFAARFVTESPVLDIACGVGYGTSLLAEAATSDGIEAAIYVDGVDCSPSAIEYANSHFGTTSCRFFCSDALAFLSERQNKYATLVSLETIEHLQDPRAFLQAAALGLRSGGCGIFSVPVSPTVDINPHHLHDFTVRSFRKLLQGVGFCIIDEFPQLQHVTLSQLLRTPSYRKQGDAQGLLSTYLRNPMQLQRRIMSCVRDGFSTRYLTVAARKAGN